MSDDLFQVMHTVEIKPIKHQNQRSSQEVKSAAYLFPNMTLSIVTLNYYLDKPVSKSTHYRILLLAHKEIRTLRKYVLSYN